MSQSKAPTLPWAIPMYQHMQESLHANLADPSLPPRMHRAIRKGLVKLEHYYDLAKLNHFNVIATGTSSCVSLANTFLQLVDLTVCHPALHLSWFRSISNDSYDRAKEVFKYHFQEYQASTLEPTPLQPASVPVESKSFLASIARCSSASLTTATPKPASEHERYALLEHGIQESDALENPLMWWKVSALQMPLL